MLRHASKLMPLGPRVMLGRALRCINLSGKYINEISLDGFDKAARNTNSLLC